MANGRMGDVQPVACLPQSAFGGRREWLGLGALLAAALFGLAVYLWYGARAASNFGFPLDDSWIHLQIARNVASGNGWSFNPGESTGASTTPLWVLVITPLFWFPGDVTTWVKALGCLLFLANVALVADIARRITDDPRIGWLAGLLAAWQPAFLWAALSGMEVHFYLLLTLLGLRCLLRAEAPHPHAARCAYAATGWLALAGCARPEVWFLLPVAWGYLWWRRRELAAGRAWRHLLIAVAAVAAFAAFNLLVWGRPLPETWYAKTAFGAGNVPVSAIEWLLHFSNLFVSSVQAAVYVPNPLLVVTIALGVVALAQTRGLQARRLALVVAVVLASVAAAALADLGGVHLQNYRRAAPLVACLDVLAAAGAVALWDVMRRNAEQVSKRQAGSLPYGPLAGAAVVLAMQLAGVRQGTILYANDVRSINQGDVAAARWLAANTPAGARIAANDIGAMAYFGGRHIVDLIGLASPEVMQVLETSRPNSADRERRLRDLLAAQGVTYVVIFPEWFPWLARDPLLSEVIRFTVSEATALAHESVVVYRLAP